MMLLMNFTDAQVGSTDEMKATLALIFRYLVQTSWHSVCETESFHLHVTHSIDVFCLDWNMCDEATRPGRRC